MLFLSGRASSPIHSRERRGGKGPGRMKRVRACHPAPLKQLWGDPFRIQGRRQTARARGGGSSTEAVGGGGNITFLLVDWWTVWKMPSSYWPTSWHMCPIVCFMAEGPAWGRGRGGGNRLTQNRSIRIRWWFEGQLGFKGRAERGDRKRRWGKWEQPKQSVL